MFKNSTTAFLFFVSTIAFSQTLTFHDYGGKTILGDTLLFSAYHGKKVMVVNTATYCTWTYQYEALESLYTHFQDSGFAIIGFPCNDFSAQEPHDDSTINGFCIDEYGINFQMMSKIATISQDTAEVYKWLQRGDLNGVQDAHVLWNFHKFLIDEAGHWVAYYSNLTEPWDPAIVSWIRSPSVLPPDTIDSTNTGIMDNSKVRMIAPGIASDYLRLSFENLNSSENTMIEVYSANGQLTSATYNGMIHDGEEIPIDVKPLHEGMYFLVVRNAQMTRTSRFAVIR